MLNHFLTSNPIHGQLWAKTGSWLYPSTSAPLPIWRFAVALFQKAPSQVQTLKTRRGLERSATFFVYGADSCTNKWIITLVM